MDEEVHLVPYEPYSVNRVDTSVFTHFEYINGGAGSAWYFINDEDGKDEVREDNLLAYEEEDFHA